MPESSTISLIALVISIVSLAFSVYVGLLDRAHIRTTCKFYHGDPDYGPAHAVLSILNSGRRSVIIRWLVFANDKGEWIGVHLKSEQGGLRLGEHERHDEDLKVHDLFQSTPDGILEVTDCWFEDTLGRRHRPKGIRACLKRLRDS
jgi:hypothetical protein